jgi:hypothetical protein
MYPATPPDLSIRRHTSKPKEQCFSGEANGRSDSQKILPPILNPKFQLQYPYAPVIGNHH